MENDQNEKQHNTNSVRQQENKTATTEPQAPNTNTTRKQMENVFEEKGKDKSVTLSSTPVQH